MAEILQEADSLDLTELESTLRRAFIARFGFDLGIDVTAEAMAWAWANRGQVAEADNPAGLLYRVGQSRSRRYLRWRKLEIGQAKYPAEFAQHSPGWVEPGLEIALAELEIEQRTAVILVHCFEWTYPEVAELLEVPLHTVRNRVHRGLQKLRTKLGVDDE